MKKHFLILDGLRGVAALVVVVFHFTEWVYPDYTKNFIGHGFLAVDFFFCLSGFVIAYAYDSRIGEMGIAAFFRSRLIRLHPLVIAGSVLGLLGFLIDPFANHIAHYSTWKLILIFLCSISLVPFPVMPERFFNLFGLNAPSWSLFWEYIANIIYAFILCRLGRRTLIILTVIAAALLGLVGYNSGNLMGGWAKSNFWDGGARVFYSFLIGMLIFRCNWIIKNRLGFSGFIILLLLPFLMPFFKWNWLVELSIVLFYFPLLVAIGAGAAMSEGTKSVCELSGKLSYPLYMSHYAAIWIFGAYYTKYKPAGTQLFLIVLGGTLLLIGLSYMVMVLYDLPIRRYLHRRTSSPSTRK